MLAGRRGENEKQATKIMDSNFTRHISQPYDCFRSDRAPRLPKCGFAILIR